MLEEDESHETMTKPFFFFSRSHDAATQMFSFIGLDSASPQDCVGMYRLID